MNASRLIDLFLRRILRVEDTLDLTKTGILEWLDFGAGKVAELAAADGWDVRGPEAVISLVNEQSHYDLPRRCLKVRKCELLLENGERPRLLPGVFSDVDVYGAQQRQIVGGHYQYVALDDEIAIIPTPGTTTDRVAVKYWAAPPPLFSGIPTTASGTSLILPVASSLRGGRYEAPANEWYAGARLYVSAGAGQYQTLTVASAALTSGTLALTLEAAPDTALSTTTSVVDLLLDGPRAAEAAIVWAAAGEWARASADDAAAAYRDRAEDEAMNPLDGLRAQMASRQGDRPGRKRVVW